MTPFCLLRRHSIVSDSLSFRHKMHDSLFFILSFSVACERKIPGQFCRKCEFCTNTKTHKYHAFLSKQQFKHVHEHKQNATDKQRNCTGIPPSPFYPSNAFSICIMRGRDREKDTRGFKKTGRTISTREGGSQDMQQLPSLFRSRLSRK